MYNLEEFIKYYKDNKFLPYPLKLWSKKELTNTQLKTKYKQYIKKIDTKKIESSTADKIKKENHKESVSKACLLCIENNDKSLFNKWFNRQTDKNKMNMLCRYPILQQGKWDVAHIIARSNSLSLQDDIDNLVLLPHFFHLDLDNYINPINGKLLKKEAHDKLWKDIVGEERYERLQSKKHK